MSSGVAENMKGCALPDIRALPVITSSTGDHSHANRFLQPVIWITGQIRITSFKALQFLLPTRRAVAPSSRSPFVFPWSRFRWIWCEPFSIGLVKRHYGCLKQIRIIATVSLSTLPLWILSSAFYYFPPQQISYASSPSICCHTTSKVGWQLPSGFGCYFWYFSFNANHPFRSALYHYMYIFSVGWFSFLLFV